MSGESVAPTRQEILDALGAYQKRGRIGDNIRKMADLLMEESDRGVVVILGSLLEDVLLDRITKNFIELSPAQNKNLSRAGGLLSSFDDKINLAHALGAIDQGMVEMLQATKAMRNACAHSRLDISFKTPELRSALSLLFGDEENAAEIREAPLNSDLALRLFFIGAFMFMSAILRGESTESANARIQNLINTATDEALKELDKIAKRKASRETRKKRQASNPRSRPID